MFLFCVTNHLHLIEIYFVMLSMTLHRVHKEYENVCFLGDFNFPEIPWLNDNTCHHNLSSLMEDFGHVQLNNIPSNCKGNIIDLVFSNVPEKMLKSKIKDAPLSSLVDNAVDIDVAWHEWLAKIKQFM